MFVGLLVLLLMAIGAATLLGGTLVAMTLGAGDDVASETPPPPQTANAAPPEDGADPLAVATDSPKPGVRRPTTNAPPSPEAAHGEDGVAEMDVVDAGNHDAAPAAEDCDDPLSLEPSAILGQLTDGQRSCLSAAIRDTSKSQTDRGKLGRVLLVDATSRCDNGGGCAAYESEQRYYFDEIDRSDADMLYKWVSYLNGADTGGDAQRDDLLGWADKAMERKQAWRGVDYVKRVDGLLEIGAKVSYKRFEASGAEKHRVDARNRSVEWLNNRVQLGKDSKEALQLCASAAGSEEECRKRMHDEKAQATVTFVSIPVGASIVVDDKSVGDAPLVFEMAYGAHNVQMTAGDKTGVQDISVGSDSATRWVWRSKEDRWESSF